MKTTIQSIWLVAAFFLMGETAGAEIPGMEMDSEMVNLKLNDTTDDQSHRFELSIPPDSKDRKKKNVNTRYITFEMGIDVWLPEEDYRLEGTNIDPFEQRIANSTNVNIYLMRQRFNIINHKLNLEYGIGLNFHKIMFENPIVMRREMGELKFEYEPEINLRKSRLSSTYLTIPLLLNFESNPFQSKNSFRIAAGVYGNTRIGSNFKQKFKGERIKDKDSFNLSPFRWGFAGQIGYGPINFYANFSMTDVFEDSKNSGYEIGMISAGFIVIPF